MAGYSEEADIKILWPQAKDAHIGIVVYCITKAYNMINTYLCNRYSVPFTAIYPPQIVSISDELTVYYLKRSLNPGAGDLDDRTVDSYVLAKNELEALRDGKTHLVDSDGNLVADNLLPDSNTRSYQPIFEQYK